MALLAFGLAFPSAGAEPVATLPPEAGLAVASSNVKLVANIPDISAIGARIRGDLMYVTGVDGLTIYDIGLTGLPIPIGALPLPHWENEDVDTNGKLLLIAADHVVGTNQVTGTRTNALYVIDVSIPQAPILLSRTEVQSAHTVSCILDCRFAWLAGDSGIAVMDLRSPANPIYAGRFLSPVGLTHDVQVDAKGIAWISGGSGIGGYLPNASKPLSPTLQAGTYGFNNDFIIHNSLRPDAKKWKAAQKWSAPITDAELIYVTEEDYLPLSNDSCKRDGSFQIGYYRQVGTRKVLEPLSRWNLGAGTSGELTGSKKGDVAAFCSSHYFDVKSKVAAVGWYEQGTRFLSVSNSSKIRQIGYWRPLNSAAWSAAFVGEYVYVFDLVRGLDVLYFDGKASDPTQKTWIDPVPRTSPSEDWGYACRIPL